MIDELGDEFVGNQEVSDDYVNGIIRKVEDVIDYSNLSERYLCKTIAKPYPESFNKLQNNVSKIINDSYGSVVVRPKSFKYGGYITASLMYKYILNSLKDDSHIKTMLYVDTNVFMEDLKRFMNKDTFGENQNIEKINVGFTNTIYDVDNKFIKIDNPLQNCVINSSFYILNYIFLNRKIHKL